jgi:hypothetical protein
MTYGIDTICKGLQSELKSLILKLTPSERGSERWIPVNPETHGTITEQTARARTFWVEPAIPEARWIGNGQRRYALSWILTIGYPPHGWEICAVSDFDDLRAEINKYGGQSTTTGVGYRVIPTEGEAFAPSRDGNWLWTRIRIDSVIETTDTARVLPNYQTKAVAAITVASSPVTVTTLTATIDGAAVYDYHVTSADLKTSRAGILQIAWDISAATAKYYDESTEDIIEAGGSAADTTAVAFAASVSGSTVSLTASSSSGNWTVRVTELSRSDVT